MQQYYSFGDERDDTLLLGSTQVPPVYNMDGWKVKLTMSGTTNTFAAWRTNLSIAETSHILHGRNSAQCLSMPPKNIPDIGLTPFAQAMSQYPDCKSEDAVQAYRNYYHAAKPFAKWDWGRPAPSWWQGFEGYNKEELLDGIT